MWLVRYNGMGPANYWGFKQLRYTEAEEVRHCASAFPDHNQIMSCELCCNAAAQILCHLRAQKCIEYWLVLLQVVRQASGVVFLGGHPTRFMAYAVEELLTWYPFVPVEKTMQVRPRDLCFPPRKPKIVSFSTPQSVHTS